MIILQRNVATKFYHYEVLEMSQFRIRYGTKHSCSYKYFKTHDEALDVLLSGTRPRRWTDGTPFAQKPKKATLETFVDGKWK
jgi:hypothetical protein